MGCEEIFKGGGGGGGGGGGLYIEPLMAKAFKARCPKPAGWESLT